MAGIERHKIEPRRKKSSHTTISGPAKNQKLMEVMFPEKSFDHTPHNVFVEMDELIDNSWVEQGRWIKYEEAREEVCHLNSMFKGRFFPESMIHFSNCPKNVPKNYPEQEILINIAILLGIPIKWQCLSLSFYGHSLYIHVQKLQRIYMPVNCQISCSR